MYPTIRLATVAFTFAACTAVPPAVVVTPAGPTAAAITPEDLRLRLEIIAHDSMMGRQAGTIYNDKATDYIGAEAARIGLRPAGENGTFFQTVPLIRRAFGASTLTAGSQTFTLWQDFLPRDQGPGMRQLAGAPTVFGGSWSDDASGLIPPADAVGKVVFIRVPRGWQANRVTLTGRYRDAAGVIVVSLDSIPRPSREALAEADVDFAVQGPVVQLPAFVYVTQELATAIFGRPLQELTPGAAGQPFTGQLVLEETPVPGTRNVVAVLEGSDPALRGQYVTFGAHNDHEGFNTNPIDHDSLRAFNRVVRPLGADSPMRQPTAAERTRMRAILDSLRAIRPPRPDSIYNGADDDGSGTVLLLEAAEAFANAATPPRRSLLFIWHTAEEAGLVGAMYYSDNPTVPRDSIVTMINIDMVGRGRATELPEGGPGYVQAIGSRRLSSELGRIIDEVAATTTPRIQLDYQYDAPRHPQQFYCRSDHYMYARYGIPVAFFSTGSHADYHQLTDEAQYIDYDKLALVTTFVQRIGERLALQPSRPVVDQPRPDPDAPCVQ
jgi:hypothetical protein